MHAEIRIGSRGSSLALAQAGLVQQALELEGRTSRIVIIETEGDRRASDTAWGEGAFVAAIEQALLAGRVDIAVHSAKDVPTDEDPRLRIAAYLPRADPRDALVVRPDAEERRLAELPPGARVGTDSPRRTGFLLAHRSDLLVRPLHGNVDTRLRRLDDGDADALVLACAGLDRMDLADRIAERIDPELIPPAPGQGAIAIQVRCDDPRMLSVGASLDDRPTRLAVEAERAFLTASGGGCRAPVGALATVIGEELEVLAGYAAPDGSRATLARLSGPVDAGARLGRDLAAQLSPRPPARVSAAPRVIVTRAAGQADELVAALRAVGLDPWAVPAIAVELDLMRGDLDAAVGRLATYDWVTVTSTNGARALIDAAEGHAGSVEASRFAAIGSATGRALAGAGFRIGFQPSRSTAAAMADELPVTTGDRVLVVRGNLADEDLAGALRERGADVDDIVAYRTSEAPERSRELLRDAAAQGPIAAVVFTSASTVRGLVSLGHQTSIDVGAFLAACIGPSTADAARAAGFRILAVSPSPDPRALAETTAGALAGKRQEMA